MSRIPVNIKEYEKWLKEIVEKDPPEQRCCICGSGAGWTTDKYKSCVKCLEKARKGELKGWHVEYSSFESADVLVPDDDNPVRKYPYGGPFNGWLPVIIDDDK